MSSKYERKRKRDLDVDTSEEGKSRKERSSPPRTRSKRKERSESPRENGGGGGGREESLSIEETNKVRAKLGLAPLELDNQPGDAAPPNRPDIQLGEGEELFNEDGVSIVHKAPKNWSADRHEEKMKEKLEAQKAKRIVKSKVLKVKKGLADSDSEEESASAWVERNRKLEEEKRKAAEKAKVLDELDEVFSVTPMIEQERKRMEQKAAAKRAREKALTSGLVVGHSKNAFIDGQETVLVLQDKGVLDDNEDEVLINPNLLENERHKKNVELRKNAKKSDYNPYDDEELDEYGQVKKQNILSKYDNGIDGEKQERETFRLDQTGGYDLDKEVYEEEVRRKLMMANKKFESLELPKNTLAREFYTEEEMISFRRPKKKKDSNKIRKRKTLKASDLAVEDENGETAEERELRAQRLAARRGEDVEMANSSVSAVKSESSANAVEAAEDGELVDEEGKPSTLTRHGHKRETMGALVDVNKLKSFVTKKVASAQVKAEDEEDESDSDEDLVGGVDLSGVVLDDDAEDELHSILERTRKLKQVDAGREDTGVARVVNRLLKAEPVDEDEEEEADESGRKNIVFDATSEQYKAIGEISNFGLAGNRQFGIDYSAMDDVKEDVQPKASSQHTDGREAAQRDEDGEESRGGASHHHEEKRKKKKKKSKSDRGTWALDEEDLKLDVDRPSSSKTKDDSDDDEKSDDDGYHNVLGEEKDVTKGVAAMLKLAGIKGYLENGNSRRAGDGALKHLESKRFSRVEQGRYDIEDKTMRKLERMGTTGTGPVRAFAEKANYKPNVEVTYTDKKGRMMSQKEAFREMSWKFHGKGPGKKQIEKHQAQLEKKERLKMMNSMDTPLGTLSKQRKKQEQLQTPYLVLSGSGRDTGAPLQKD